MHLPRNYLKSALARRPLQPFWRALYKISVYGMGYRLPDASISGEDHALDVLRREFARRSGQAIIVDGGARYGEFTESFAGEQAFQVHAFEPNPSSNQVLSRKFSGVPNVTLNAIALSDVVGEAELYDQGDEGSPFASTLRQRLEVFGKGIDRTTRVPTTTLDHYFAGLPSAISLLKLDIEGAEEAAIRGAANLLAKKKIEIVFLEHSHVSALTGLTIFRIGSFFSNFHIYRVIPGGVVPIRTLGRPYSPWDEVMAYCNLLLVREDLALSEETRRYLGGRVAV
jgi:FkbM family methyltransferase